MFDPTFLSMIGEGLLATLYMTMVSTLIAYVIGIPVGVALVVCDKDGIKPMPVLFRFLDIVVNIMRSVPFLILMITVIPLTRLIVGTSIGATATIVPLTIAAAPFIGRMVEQSLREVDPGIIEAALSMGASPGQIIFKVLLPEALPSLIVGAAIAITTILGYSAMAGAVGGGGLGDIAIRYGYYRYETAIMIICVILLVLVVQIFQIVGMRFASKIDRRKS